MRTLIRGFKWRKRAPGDSSSLLPNTNQAIVKFLAFFLLTIDLANCQQTTNVNINQQYYYVTLPKLGPIRGLKLEDAAVSGQQQFPAAAVFLGLPYAAPPVGLLRFMPPGAAGNPNHQRPANWCLLMQPGAGRQLQKLPARDHTFPGNSCVHLADWPPSPVANDATSGSVQAANKHQSEDCLNLNVFIPINESMRRQQQQQQQQNIKSNYPSQVISSVNATTTILLSSNSSNDKLQQQDINRELPEIWPLPRTTQANGSGDPLPVLVLFHGNSKESRSSFAYANLARETGSIVISFSHRIGLLGFLPYASDGSRWLARNNHATWDQIGLLHWLKRNAIYFGAEPQNISLVAVNQKANFHLQLLMLSPLARGLFKRVILMRDTNQSPNPFGDLGQLIHSIAGHRDKRRQFGAKLAKVVQQLIVGEQPATDRQVAEFIQGASLSQLAQIERGLSRLNASELATEPNLDDRLLFPQLNALQEVAQQPASGKQQLKVIKQVEKLRRELNFCQYARHLAAGHSDYLNLTGAGYNENAEEISGEELSSRGHLATGEGSGGSGWRRDESQNRRTPATSALAVAAQLFEHLNRIQQLDRLLLSGDNSSPLISDTDQEEEEEDEDYIRGNNRQKALAFGNHQMVKREAEESTAAQDNKLPQKRSPADQSGDEGDPFSAVLDLIGSVDLLLAAEWRQPKSTDGGDKLLFNKATGTRFNNILNTTSMNIQRQSKTNIESFDWLKFADLHYISSFANSISQQCDIFAPKPKGRGTNYVLLLENKNSAYESSDNNKTEPKIQNEPENWILDSLIPSKLDKGLLEGIGSFVKFGYPSHTKIHSMSQSYWPTFDTLNRRIKQISSGQPQQQVKFAQLRDLASILLDLVPYLNNLNTEEELNGNATYHKLIVDSITCLSSLDESLAADSYVRPEVSTAAACLTQTGNKFKVQLRHLMAADEFLRPILSIRSHRWPSQAANLSGQALNSTTRVASSIATRNLVTDMNGIELQPSYSAEGFSPNSSDIQSGNPSSVALNGNSSSNNRSASGNRLPVSGFFARLYRDSAGRALALVVFSGLFIFLANLVIVVVISVRTARARRRCRQQQDENAGDEASRAAPIALKRSSLKRVTADNGTPPTGSVAAGGSTLANGSSSFLGPAAGCETSLSRKSAKSKQLKFDLSGVDRHNNDPSRGENTTGNLNLPAETSGGGCCLGHEHHQLHMMLLPEDAPTGSSQVTCVEGNGPPELLLSATHPMLSGDHNYSDQILSQFIGDQPDDEQSPANWLLSCGPSPENGDSHPAATDRSSSSHLSRQQQQQRHNCGHHNLHGGSLNSPAYGGSQSTTNTCQNSTASSQNNVAASGYCSRQLTGKLALDEPQLRLPFGSSPDSSATLSMTPIQLHESMAGAGPLSFSSPEASTEQHQSFQLLEPFGLLYPANALMVQRQLPEVDHPSGEKLFFASHNQTNEQSNGRQYCFRHK